MIVAAIMGDEVQHAPLNDPACDGLGLWGGWQIAKRATSPGRRLLLRCTVGELTPVANILSVSGAQA